jgi:hypothetical protein
MYHPTTAFLKCVLLLCAALALISCAPAAAPQPPTPTPPMSLAEAQQIALQSDCMQVGRTKDTGVYNPNSNTWWIDLDATARGCNPACVVNVATKTAEVNWRCTGAAVPPQIMTPTSSQIANPASENCVKQGGTVSIQTRGDGGQYGVCLFEDNMQCEEWAMLRGDCPVGGIKVTGYVTPAAQYCAITGGTYAVTGNPNTDNEQGTCTFKNGKTCDAWAYYNGTCSSTSEAQTPTTAAIQPLPEEVCNGQAQAMAHALNVVEVTQSTAPLSDPETGASGTGCQATVTGTGEQFKSPDAVVNTLGNMLKDEGWTEDPMLAAGGPTGIGAGYRKGDQICMAAAQWWPDDSANCPKDQPISACQVTPEQQLYTVTLNCGQETK